MMSRRRILFPFPSTASVYTIQAVTSKTIVLVSPHGFCAGVERAVAMAEALLQKQPRPLYCLRQIVHNTQIIEDLAGRGLVFVNDIREIPRGATVLFSAHGVSPAVRETATVLNLDVVDATCPFVTKVHLEVKRFAAKGYSIVLVGHRAHDEIVGVAGEAPDRVIVVENEDAASRAEVPEPSKVAVITQTTISLDDAERVLSVLRKRFPGLRTPPQKDICYATRNRQQAVREVAPRVEAFIVLGARNSSNSNRLVEMAKAQGCPAYLASTVSELDSLPLDAVRSLGLTAGASTPEYVVHEAIERLKTKGFDRVEEIAVVKEDLHFSLPTGVKAAE